MACFKSNGKKVYVGDKEQTSSITANDFSNPVNYTVVSENGEKKVYTVNLNISRLPVVYIDTPNAVAITSKEDWTKNSSIKIINTDGSEDYSNNKLQIRGRGNSTWTYPKKPYALKLKDDSEILGMPAHKRWVLLANWMDRTLLRNDVSFQIAKQTCMEWTPRGKFVEVVLNGKHIGNYYLCEQIKVDANRVNIAKMETTDVSGDALTGGYLMEWMSISTRPTSLNQRQGNCPICLRSLMKTYCNQSNWHIFRIILTVWSQDYIRAHGFRPENMRHSWICNEINIGLWPISSSVNGDEKMSFDAAIDRMVKAYEEKLSWLNAQITAM